MPRPERFTFSATAKDPFTAGQVSPFHLEHSEKNADFPEAAVQSIYEVQQRFPREDVRGGKEISIGSSLSLPSLMPRVPLGVILEAAFADDTRAFGELFDDAEFFGDRFAGELTAVGCFAFENLLTAGHSRNWCWKFPSGLHLVDDFEDPLKIHAGGTLSHGVPSVKIAIRAWHLSQALAPARDL